MGAQQSKSEEELVIAHSDKQQYGPVYRESKDGQELMNEINIETVMSEQNVLSVSTTKHISVAKFAKIKIEPRAQEECSSEQVPLLDDQSNFQESTEGKKKDQEIQKDQLVSKDSHSINSVQRLLEPLENIFVISSPAVDGSCLFNPLSSVDLCQNISKIELKKELIESYGLALPDATNNSRKDEHADAANEGSTIPLLTKPADENKYSYNATVKTESIKDNCNVGNILPENIVLECENKDNYQKTIRSESIEEICIVQNVQQGNKILTQTENYKFKEEEIVNDNSNEKSKENINQPGEIHKFVKNPFCKRNPSKKKYFKQYEFDDNYYKHDSANKIIKSEFIHINEELVSEGTTKVSTTTEIIPNDKIILEKEAAQTSINLNELIIKSETLPSPDHIPEYDTNPNLSINCLSSSLNSSLDVNLSNAGTDLDERLSVASLEDVISNISISSSRGSAKYYSIIEVSSVENGDLPVQNSTRTSTPKKKEQLKSSERSFKRRPYKTRQKAHLKKSNFGKIQKQNKRDRKPRTKTQKSRKHTQRDSSFVGGFSKKTILKNLPKSCIKTRRKQNAHKKTSETVVGSKEDFPKPFKTEPAPQPLHKEHNIAMDLPKPMKFKSETDVSNKIYLKREFQPCVRLKRLKSEELLVPLKTRKRARKDFQPVSNHSRRDFLIHQAFSLNQRVKLNRLSIDHDHSYFNNNNNSYQPSLYSRMTTPYSLPTDTPNGSVAETDSKYFSAQELYSLFQSSTPDGSSMFSGLIDSGVSTSTPSMLQLPHADSNKTLLLEIAAERAFINNHLMHFGYSPMQFDLFNNPNDLNVFLKYLLGSVNTE